MYASRSLMDKQDDLDYSKDRDSFVIQSESESRTLGIIQEFRLLYEEKMKIIENADGKGDCNLQAKLSLQNDWIRDLNEQNEMLVRAVEELEQEATERVMALEEKLRQSGKCACELKEDLNEKQSQIKMLESKLAESVNKECQKCSSLRQQMCSKMCETRGVLESTTLISKLHTVCDDLSHKFEKTIRELPPPATVNRESTISEIFVRKKPIRHVLDSFTQTETLIPIKKSTDISIQFPSQLNAVAVAERDVGATEPIKIKSDKKRKEPTHSEIFGDRRFRRTLGDHTDSTPKISFADKTEAEEDIVKLEKVLGNDIPTYLGVSKCPKKKNCPCNAICKDLKGKDVLQAVPIPVPRPVHVHRIHHRPQKRKPKSKIPICLGRIQKSCNCPVSPLTNTLTASIEDCPCPLFAATTAEKEVDDPEKNSPFLEMFDLDLVASDEPTSSENHAFFIGANSSSDKMVNDLSSKRSKTEDKKKTNNLTTYPVFLQTRFPKMSDSKSFLSKDFNNLNAEEKFTNFMQFMQFDGEKSKFSVNNEDFAFGDNKKCAWNINSKLENSENTILKQASCQETEDLPKIQSTFNKKLDKSSSYFNIESPKMNQGRHQSPLSFAPFKSKNTLKRLNNNVSIKFSKSILSDTSLDLSKKPSFQNQNKNEKSEITTGKISTSQIASDNSNAEKDIFKVFANLSKFFECMEKSKWFQENIVSNEEKNFQEIKKESKESQSNFTVDKKSSKTLKETNLRERPLISMQRISVENVLKTNSEFKSLLLKSVAKTCNVKNFSRKVPKVNKKQIKVRKFSFKDSMTITKESNIPCSKKEILDNCDKIKEAKTKGFSNQIKDKKINPQETKVPSFSYKLNRTNAKQTKTKRVSFNEKITIIKEPNKSPLKTGDLENCDKIKETKTKDYPNQREESEANKVLKIIPPNSLQLDVKYIKGYLMEISKYLNKNFGRFVCSCDANKSGIASKRFEYFQGQLQSIIFHDVFDQVKYLLKSLLNQVAETMPDDPAKLRRIYEMIRDGIFKFLDQVKTVALFFINREVEHRIAKEKPIEIVIEIRRAFKGIVLKFKRSSDQLIYETVMGPLKKSPRK